MTHWIRFVLLVAFAFATFSCADIDESELVDQSVSPMVFDSDTRTVHSPVLPVYRIRIRQGNGSYEYCTATVYSAAKHHFVTDARCFFTWKNGAAVQVANSDISIQWVTGGASWSDTITNVMIAPGYLWSVGVMGDDLLDPRSQPTRARSYAFFRTSWNTSATPLLMEKTRNWFDPNINCGGSYGCGNDTTFVFVGAQPLNADYTGCRTTHDLIQIPLNCQHTKHYYSTFTIKPVQAAMKSCYKTWCKTDYPFPDVAPPFANMAGDCLMQDGNEMYEDGGSGVFHKMDASTLYGVGSDNFGGDLGGPILNSTKTKIMGIMTGPIYRGPTNNPYANMWIPTVEIALVKNPTTCQYNQHNHSTPADHAAMWEYADYFASVYP